MITTCAVYQNGVRDPNPLPIVDAFEAGRELGAFVWVALQTPTEEEFAAVNVELSLHPVAVEDAMQPHQRAKLEVFDNSIFVVVKTARYNDELETIATTEVHVFIGDGFVVSVDHSDGLESHRIDLELAPIALTRFGQGAILHAFLDHAVNGYERVIDGIENDIDELEAQVFAAERTNSAERIFRLKRQVLAFHRAVLPLEVVLDQLVRNQVPDVCSDEALREYFRAILDHTIRVLARIDTAKETLGAALEANLAQVSVRQNEDMRAMSGWAAVIAVPTLFAGIWGMNFQHMPELNVWIGYPVALATIVVSAAIVRWKLHRNGWL